MHARPVSGTLPAWIGELTLLVDFDVSTNSLEGTIPASIGDLTALVTLSIAGNPNVSGTLPASIGRLRCGCHMRASIR